MEEKDLFSSFSFALISIALLGRAREELAIITWIEIA